MFTDYAERLFEPASDSKQDEGDNSLNKNPIAPQIKIMFIDYKIMTLEKVAEYLRGKPPGHAFLLYSCYKDPDWTLCEGIKISFIQMCFYVKILSGDHNYIELIDMLKPYRLFQTL